MNGRIFNIQKFSLHDGPGIRTVVFFKGCPLRCRWCSNPESQSFDKEILCDHQKCTRCLSCVKHCPHQAISLIDNNIHIDSNKCTKCLSCISICPNHALSVEGEDKSIDEIMKVIMQDFDFYIESNGGVTISGGEALSQSSFVVDLINACKDNDINVAMETTGYSDLNTFKNVIKDVDLLLYDLKHYDSDKHLALTDVPNELIIENMKYALSINKDIIIRIPVIPNYNDSLEDAAKFSQLLSNIGIKKVNLLPFHQFGLKKYEMLNLDYTMKDCKQLYPEDLKEYQDIFIKNNLDCYF